MVERSSTAVINNIGGRFSSSRTDRAIGAAVTVGIGVFIVKVASRYLRRHDSTTNNSSKGYDDGESWLQWLRAAIKRRRDKAKNQPLASLVVHRATCHCRSVVFEFRTLPVIDARDGNGKIHYPHVQVKASDFCILSGGEMLQMYYILVPADGSSTGVAPITAAFTFCSRCGVHVVHAPSAHSTLLDVNVDCLDSEWKLSKTNDSFSQGVSVSDQWDARDNAIVDDADSDIRNQFFSAGHLTALTGVEDQVRPINESWGSADHKDIKSNLFTPGTPTTVSTGGTDSQHLTEAAQSFDAHDIGSEGSSLELPPAATSRLLPPPIDTSLPSSSSAEGPSSTTSQHTTPMMRDQLKYYMSKHVSSSGKKLSSPLQSSTSSTRASPTSVDGDTTSS